MRVLVGQCGHLGGDQLLCQILHGGIQCGLDREPRPVDRLRVVVGLQLRSHVVHPVGIPDVDVGGRKVVSAHLDRCVRGLGRIHADRLVAVAHMDAVLFDAGSQHEPQHLLIALQRGPAVRMDVVDRG